MFREFYNQFKQLLNGDLCLNCPDSKIEFIREMSGSEMEEWASIRAEEIRINKEIDKLAKCKELIYNRKNILMGKAQLESGEFESQYKIKDGKFYKVECKSSDCGKLPPLT